MVRLSERHKGQLSKKVELGETLLKPITWHNIK